MFPLLIREYFSLFSRHIQRQNGYSKHFVHSFICPGVCSALLSLIIALLKHGTENRTWESLRLTLIGSEILFTTQTMFFCLL